MEESATNITGKYGKNCCVKLQLHSSMVSVIETRGISWYLIDVNMNYGEIIFT